MVGTSKTTGSTQPNSFLRNPRIAPFILILNSFLFDTSHVQIFFIYSTRAVKYLIWTNTKDLSSSIKEILGLWIRFSWTRPDLLGRDLFPCWTLEVLHSWKSLINTNFFKIEELWTSYLIYFELSRFSAYGRSKVNGDLAAYYLFTELIMV